MEIEEYIKNPVYIRIHFLLSAYLQHDSFAQKSKAAIRTVYYVLNNAVVCTNTDGNVSWYCFLSGIKKCKTEENKTEAAVKFYSILYSLYCI